MPAAWANSIQETGIVFYEKGKVKAAINLRPEAVRHSRFTLQNRLYLGGP